MITRAVGDGVPVPAEQAKHAASDRKARLVGAAGAAAAGVSVRGSFALGALFHLEGVPAAARRGRVRVVDLEARLLQAGEEVDRGALEVRDAEGIDDDVDTLERQ